MFFAYLFSFSSSLFDVRDDGFGVGVELLLGMQQIMRNLVRRYVTERVSYVNILSCVYSVYSSWCSICSFKSMLHTKFSIVWQQRKAESQGVTEDDVNEIKQDISAFRCEIVEILKGKGTVSGQGAGKQIENNNIKQMKQQ